MQLHDFTLEATIIGTFLRFPKTLAVMGGQIEPEWFDDPLLNPIFIAFREQADSGNEISFSFLKAELRKHNVAGTQGMSESDIITAITNEAQVPTALPALIDKLREYWSRRKLAEISEEIKTSSTDPLIDPDQTATDFAVVLESLSDRDETAIVGTLDEAKASYFESLKDKNRMRGATTGLVDLDRKIGGYKRGFYYVIGGRPGAGKTAVALSSTFKSACSGFGVFMPSLEMSQEEIFARLVSELAHRKFGNDAPEYQSLLSATATDDQLSMVLDVADTLKEVPFVYDTSATLTIHQIKSRARARKAELERNGQTLDIVCVDHMGLVKAAGTYRGNKTAETGEISGHLREMAKELDCAVIALCQLSRANTERENKRPTLSDLRWAGEIEQDAHAVLFIHREAYYADADSMLPDEYQKLCRDLEVIAAKNRNGAVGTIHLDINLAYNRIDSSNDPYRNT